jgi:hypothetical protein
MIPFDTVNRFKILDDGLLYSSAGVQTNCGGIAAIIAKIERIDSECMEFIAVDNENWNGNIDSDGDVPGLRMREIYRNSVFDGAKYIFDKNGIYCGYRFVLVEAMMHPIDSMLTKFREAGMRLVDGWINREK